jgi:hypothetical protein
MKRKASAFVVKDPPTENPFAAKAREAIAGL